MKVISFWVKRKVPRVSINVGKQTCECLFQLALHWSSMEGKRRLWSLMLDCQLFKNKHIDHITAMVCMLGIGVVKKIDSNQNYQIQKMKWPFKKKDSDRDRTRTCNLQIRSLAPYPLGHTVSYWPMTLPVKPTSASYQTMLQCSSLQL